MVYEQVTESTLKRLQNVGAIRSCTLLCLPDDAGYALSFSVSGVSGGAMILRSHREPVRVFKNPAIAFHLAAQLGFQRLDVSLLPFDPIRQLANLRTPEAVPGAASFAQFCQTYGLKPGGAAEREYQAYLNNLDLFSNAADDAGVSVGSPESINRLANQRTERRPANLTGVARQADPNGPDSKKRAAARAKRKKTKR